MVGRIISHYKILEKIGQGGMGKVRGSEPPRLIRYKPAPLSKEFQSIARFSMKAMGKFVILLLSLVCVWASAQTVGVAQDYSPEVLAYADIVLVNGKILTVDQNFSIAQALAVRDGKILAVGENDRILNMAGPSTKRVDLQGKTVTPGFIDTHYHLGDYALSRMLLEEKGIAWEGRIEWMGLLWRDTEMAVRDIKRAVDAAAPGELVRLVISIRDREIGQEVVPKITLSHLDAVSPNNPVILVSSANLRPRVANTRAIEAAQIAAGTPGLPGDGSAAVSGRAMSLLSDYVTAAVPVEQVIPWYKQAMELSNRWGLTTVDTRITPDEFNAIREIWLAGELTVRWRVAFPGLVVYRTVGNLSDIGDDWLRISGAGSGNVPGYRSALGHWSSKVPADNSVRTSWQLRRGRLLEALRYGWSIPNTHITGNLAVRAFLDIIEEAKNSPIVKSSNQRFTMDHMEEVDDTDIERMKRLGVSPSSLMRNVFYDSTWGSSGYTSVFGADHVDRMLPLKKYLEAGLRPTLEADTGEEVRGEPLWTIEKAVTRRVDGSSRVWGPEQRLSRQDALRMKTLWSAAAVGDEKQLGSLEVGKLADFVVLGGDYLAIPEEQISDLPVLMTVVGGKLMYEKN